MNYRPLSLEPLIKMGHVKVVERELQSFDFNFYVDDDQHYPRSVFISYIIFLSFGMILTIKPDI